MLMALAPLSLCLLLPFCSPWWLVMSPSLFLSLLSFFLLLSSFSSFCSSFSSVPSPSSSSSPLLLLSFSPSLLLSFSFSSLTLNFISDQILRYLPDRFQFTEEWRMIFANYYHEPQMSVMCQQMLNSRGSFVIAVRDKAGNVASCF